jgi:serine/threonine protein kinase
MQVATQLACMHENGVYHGDVKMENIVATGRPKRWKLVDFGLSRKIGDLESTHKGTPIYMSPRKLRNQGTGAEHDAWALGLVLYGCIRHVSGFLTESQEREIEDLMERGESSTELFAGYQQQGVDTVVHTEFYPEDPVMQNVIRALLQNSAPLAALIDDAH